MNNKSLSLFNKGDFKPISNDFMTEGHEGLQELAKLQEKYNKHDTDTFINELRDSIAGYTLGFDLVNTEKHGFDCKKQSKDLYLEVKSASFSSSTWNATFNDTTYEKAEAFKDKKVYLALAIWKNASDLLFIIYGQNEKIGEFLENRIKWFKSGHTVRSTQSISASQLINEYGFKILAVNKNKIEVLNILRLKSISFKKLTLNDIEDLSEFKGL